MIYLLVRDEKSELFFNYAYVLSLMVSLNNSGSHLRYNKINGGVLIRGVTAEKYVTL